GCRTTFLPSWSENSSPPKITLHPIIILRGRPKLMVFGKSSNIFTEYSDESATKLIVGWRFPIRLRDGVIALEERAGRISNIEPQARPMLGESGHARLPSDESEESENSDDNASNNDDVEVIDIDNDDTCGCLVLKFCGRAPAPIAAGIIKAKSIYVDPTGSNNHGIGFDVCVWDGMIDGRGLLLLYAARGIRKAGIFDRSPTLILCITQYFKTASLRPSDNRILSMNRLYGRDDHTYAVSQVSNTVLGICALHFTSLEWLSELGGAEGQYSDKVQAM
ncbi:hypothetical protein BGZ63DRAFT_446565, partial [Mariannaea sp. PMI_226]